MRCFVLGWFYIDFDLWVKGAKGFVNLVFIWICYVKFFRNREKTLFEAFTLISVWWFSIEWEEPVARSCEKLFLSLIKDQSIFHATHFRPGGWTSWHLIQYSAFAQCPSCILTKLFRGQKHPVSRNNLEFFMACWYGLSCFLFDFQYQDAVQNSGNVCVCLRKHCDSGGTKIQWHWSFCSGLVIVLSPLF